MTATRLRFGLFGTGFWARTVHGAVLASSEHAELVGVWGRDPAKAASVAEELSAECAPVRAYDDIDALIGDVDAIAVALPPDVQGEIAERAARAGKHLLLDKPITLDTAAAGRLVGAAQATGVASVVFFTNRFDAGIEAFLHGLVARGGWDGARVAAYARIFTPGNPFGESPWRKERGGLWDIGPHALSLVLPVLGPAASVSAVGGPHATTYVTVAHESGAVSTLALTLDAPEAALLHEQVFWGAAGWASVPPRETDAQQAFAVAIERLATAAATGVPDDCDVRFGRDVVAVLEASEQSRVQGRAIRVP